MNKFKVGDKVKVVKPCASLHLGLSEIYEVKRVSSSETLQIDDSPYYWDFGRFELVKDTPEFDMKKEKWFIRIDTKEESIVVQNWLFEQGFSWSGMKVVRKDFPIPCAIGFGRLHISTLELASEIYWEYNEYPEIKVSFKTIIDSVEYPVVETEQDKAIRALEETIAKAAEQIKQLKGEGK